MFDHITLNVSDFLVSREFYTAALAPLGYKILAEESNSYCGLGKDRPQFWISQGGEGYPVAHGAHIALFVEDKAAVDAFYEAAIKAGGEDNGKPGPRPEYGESYYSAFVRDPDGNNIEAVYRG